MKVQSLLFIHTLLSFVFSCKIEIEIYFFVPSCLFRAILQFSCFLISLLLTLLFLVVFSVLYLIFVCFNYLSYARHRYSIHRLSKFHFRESSVTEKQNAYNLPPIKYIWSHLVVLNHIIVCFYALHNNQIFKFTQNIPHYSH